VIVRFKEKRGDVFVFDGGCAGSEFTLECLGDSVYNFKGFISITPILEIIVCGVANYSDIQTAVNLMQLLIKEGLV